jgi:hypothetical protein
VPSRSRAWPSRARSSRWPCCAAPRSSRSSPTRCCRASPRRPASTSPRYAVACATSSRRRSSTSPPTCGARRRSGSSSRGRAVRCCSWRGGRAPPRPSRRRRRAHSSSTPGAPSRTSRSIPASAASTSTRCGGTAPTARSRCPPTSAPTCSTRRRRPRSPRTSAAARRGSGMTAGGEGLVEFLALMAREILDSRGNPTVEVEVLLDDGAIGRAAVPSGASTGAVRGRRAARRRQERYLGKGVQKAVAQRQRRDRPRARGLDAATSARRPGADRARRHAQQGRLGANAILGVSLAVAKAAAESAGLPLYRYLGGPTPTCCRCR